MRLTLVVLSAMAAPVLALAQSFHFTASADPRNYDSTFDTMLAGIQSRVGDLGVFHASPGDIDPPAPIRAKIDARFGTSARWYPGVGNHEAETASDMAWLRAEYTTGNGIRTPLKNITNQDGPLGCQETMYSWDYGNAHFVQLNQYWNGGTAAGSDAATQGDINDAIYNWLVADLAENKKPAVFVFGHEPAYPFNRHVGDSLDQYPANRDRFWNLLEQKGVLAFIVGHTHVYSKYQKTAGKTWQIDLGNAGNGSPQTFLDVVVTDQQVRYDIYDNSTGAYGLRQSWTAPVPAALPGDATYDGKVDFADYLILEANYGNPGDFGTGDFDHSGTVDFADYLILESNFGAGATLPEPTTLALLLLGALHLRRRR